MRPLVKFDSNGEIAADLVMKWEIKDQYKQFIFTLKDDQRFSDGSIITTNDVISSLKYLNEDPKIVHSDGKKIKTISAIDNSKFEIILFESDPFFLTELSSPEYRIVKSGQPAYKISSGPYIIEKSDKHELTFKLNEKYNFPTAVKYKEVHFQQYDAKQTISDELLKKLDIIWPKPVLSPDEIGRFKNAGFNLYEMNLGFSFWFAFNPMTLNKEERLYLKNKLNAYWQYSPFFTDNILTRSYQLFLPYGPGRLTEKDIHEIEVKQSLGKNIKKTLSVLLSKTAQSEIEKSLLSTGIKLKIEYYENFTEYAKLIKNKKYDIVFVNNDLSSIDLRSSLIVTFNPSRPLVFIDKQNGQYEDLLKLIKNEQSTPLRHQGIKKLGHKILEDVLVYPLFYKMGLVLTKNNINLSDWNKAGAETFVWKIK